MNVCSLSNCLLCFYLLQGLQTGGNTSPVLLAQQASFVRWPMSASMMIWGSLADK